MTPTDEQIQAVFDALDVLDRALETYINESEYLICDTDFDRSGALAASHSKLKVVGTKNIRERLAALRAYRPQAENDGNSSAFQAEDVGSTPAACSNTPGNKEALEAVEAIEDETVIALGKLGFTEGFAHVDKLSPHFAVIRKALGGE